MAISLQQVAERAGVSTATVSKILSKTDLRFKENTLKDVLRAAEELGYQPNRAARALATGRTNLVALQMYRLSSPYAWMVSQHMQTLLAADGYEVVAREFVRGDLALATSVDGIIALGTRHVPEVRNPRLSVPYVLMREQSLHTHTFDAVEVRLQPGIRQAMQHLIDSGRRRIAHVTSVSPSQAGDTRCDEYRAVMAEAGLAPEIIEVVDDTREAGLEAIENRARQGDLPDALLCRNDELAIGCLRALHTLGRAVPDDVAIIGCDGIDEGKFSQPSLSTIVSPLAEMCDLAWQFLHRRIEEADSPQQTALLTSSLLIRESA